MIGNRYAILIGLDDQDEDGLNYCSKDVDDIYDVLISHCNFKSQHIFKICSPVGKENINAHIELETVFERLTDEFLIKGNDTLFVYYSGHGRYDISNETSFLQFPQKDLSTSKMKEYFDGLTNNKTILLFDACFVGASVLSKSHNAKKLSRKLHIDSKGVYGIYASPIEREAYQPEELKNSLLTHHFIESIKDVDIYDKSNLLSIDSLASICSNRVYEASVKLKQAKKILKEQIIVREGRIEGYFPFSSLDGNQGEVENQDDSAHSMVLNETSQSKSSELEEDENSDEYEVMTIALENIKSCFSKFEPVIAAKIISYFSDKPYSPPYIDYKGDFDESVRKGYLDEDFDPISSNKDVRKLITEIEKFKEYITASERSDNFYDQFYEEFELAPEEYDTQTFWEEIYDLTIPSY